MERFCSNCGSLLKSNARFCSQCGNPVQPLPPFNPTPAFTPPPPPAAVPQKPPKKKKRWIGWLVACLILLLILIAAGSLIWYLAANHSDVELSNFLSDEIYFISGEKSTVTFSVSATGSPKSINLYDEDGEVLGQMLDDGEDGDETEGDGIYTCRIKIKESVKNVDTKEYSCGVGKQQSDPVALHFFVAPTEHNAQRYEQEYDTLMAELYDIESSYADENGWLSPDDLAELLDEVEELLEDAKDDEIVYLYEIGEESAYIKFTSGVGVVYMPTVEGTSSGGTEVELSYMTYQPNPDIYSSALSTYAYSVAECFEADAESFSAGEVTLELVKALPADSVILWNGHGGYCPFVKSFLCTGEYFDWAAWWFDLGYYADCVTDRILCRSTENQQDLACFTSKFVNHYCGDLDNDLIILLSCHSGQDSKLADAFLSKGATAVVGFTETVYTSYAVSVGMYTLYHMVQCDPADGQLYTLFEALTFAKAENGNNDIEWANAHKDIFENAGQEIKSSVAEPVIFGGNDANDYRLSDEVPMGTISGQVCEASDRYTPIVGAEVSIYYDDSVFATVTTDYNGYYELELPHGTFTVVTSAQDHLDFISTESVSARGTTYVQTFLMIQGDETIVGTASGTIFNSLTGIGSADVEIRFTEGWNNTSGDADVVATVVTNSYGSYTVDLNLGNYTAIVTKPGFSQNSFNIIVQEGHTENQNGFITPETAGNDYLITLTWDENPRDVDAHMYGHLSNGSDFHVYYHSMSAYDGSHQVCNLDYDDTYSYGPEHITLSVTTSDPYYFFVHKYDGYGTLASSGATVTIELNNIVVAEYHVPTSLGSSDYWNVFAIVDGRIVTSNTITSSPDVSYAD